MERQFTFTVSIQGLGTVTVSAVDENHAVEITHTKYMHQIADRKQYKAKRKYRRVS